MTDSNHVLTQLKMGMDLVFSPLRGSVAIEGPEARDFLQRMSTNNVNLLSEIHPLPSCFTDNKGRLIDHAMIFQIKNDHFVLVSSHERSEILYDWLEQFHFVEDLTLSPGPANFPISYVITSAEKLLNAKNNAGRIFSGALNSGSKINFWISMDAIPSDAIMIDDDLWQSVRIAALMPASPFEINDQYMPQNVNLDALVADNKGCYIGQEVLAKAKTYQKNVKHLCGIRLTEADWQAVQIGAPLKDFHEMTGIYTSRAPIYLAGENNALAVTVRKRS